MHSRTTPRGPRSVFPSPARSRDLYSASVFRWYTEDTHRRPPSRLSPTTPSVASSTSRVRRNGAEKGDRVLLIARNHAFHPRTPRPRSTSALYPETRAVYPGCTVVLRRTPPPLARATRSYEIHPGRNSGRVIHRRPDRTFRFREQRLTRDVTSLDRLGCLLPFQDSRGYLARF